ncbi:MAG: AraC family transcriptional regulator [Pseudomonadota bacterium]
MKKQVEKFSLSMGTDVVCRILQIDPNEMLAAAGLDQLAREGSEIRVSAKQYYDAWNTIATLTAHPDYISHLGVAIARGPIIPAFFALSCAPDLQTGSIRLAHFKALIGPTQMRVFQENTDLTIEFGSTDPHCELPPSLGAVHLVFAVEAARGATAYPMRPIAARLKASEKERRRIAGHLGVMPAYGDTAALVWAPEDARRPFVSENAALWAEFEEDLTLELAARNERLALSIRVRATLTELLPTGRSSAEDVCRTLGISRSTLQRRLRREGLAFQTVLDDLRSDLAIRYLTKSALRIDEIAVHLSYRDANSFSRSFRRWIGISPLDYRKRHESKH